MGGLPGTWGKGSLQLRNKEGTRTSQGSKSCFKVRNLEQTEVLRYRGKEWDHPRDVPLRRMSQEHQQPDSTTPGLSISLIVNPITRHRL